MDAIAALPANARSATCRSPQAAARRPSSSVGSTDCFERLTPCRGSRGVRIHRGPEAVHPYGEGGQTFVLTKWNSGWPPGWANRLSKQQVAEFVQHHEAQAAGMVGDPG